MEDGATQQDLLKAVDPKAELHGWKAIAGFFDVGLRTVQNWECERELPIRRHPGKKSAVYAKVNDLQRWQLGYPVQSETAVAEEKSIFNDNLSWPSCIYCRRPIHSKKLQNHVCLESLNILHPLEDYNKRIELLREVHDLTQAEAKLTDALVSGKSLKAAADALFISINTARDHLKWIFMKTNVKRQADLVRLILATVVYSQHNVPRAYAATNEGIL